MKGKTIAVVVALLALATLAGGQAAQAASPTFYTSATAFNNDVGVLPTEDFEEGNVPPNGVVNCGVVDPTTPTPCFDPGDILPGLKITGQAPLGMFLIGAGYYGTPSKWVVPFDVTTIEFSSPGVAAVSMLLRGFTG
ncbi:MAG: hypothetical protein ACRDJM_05220, partial [Actinomycetota bacterium]